MLLSNRLYVTALEQGTGTQRTLLAQILPCCFFFWVGFFFIFQKWVNKRVSNVRQDAAMVIRGHLIQKGTYFSKHLLRAWLQVN